MIMMIVVGLNTSLALGDKIGVCQPGSREVARSFKKKIQINPDIIRNVTMPDMN